MKFHQDRPVCRPSYTAAACRALKTPRSLLSPFRMWQWNALCSSCRNPGLWIRAGFWKIPEATVSDTWKLIFLMFFILIFMVWWMCPPLLPSTPLWIHCTLMLPFFFWTIDHFSTLQAQYWMLTAALSNIFLQVSAFSTWEKELHKIVFDPRYLLLNSEERKQVMLGRGEKGAGNKTERLLGSLPVWGLGSVAAWTEEAQAWNCSVLCLVVTPAGNDRV